MRRTTLGRSGIEVSALCLGTMTWGSAQNTEADGHAQMDMALARGLDFWDTAEVYPVNPVRVETAGRTEEIIGSWIASRGAAARAQVVLATKIAGPGETLRRGLITGRRLREAAEASLRRLGTDWIDLYQLHWPNRSHYHFRKIWGYDPRGHDPAEVEANMIDVLEEAGRLKAEGKIRAFGLSNETTWGTGRWLALADRHGLPRMATVQNEYSLLCRQFDSDWSEFAVMEEMPLLGFSPLATGLLSGKYQGDVIPPGTRRGLNPTLGGRMSAHVLPAVGAYLAIAERHGLDPAQMAIAWCLTRPFPIVPIIGATSVAQLASDIAAADLPLAPEVLAEIDRAHRAHPMPY